MQNAPETDLEYEAEQQPSQVYIADSVAKKGLGCRRSRPVPMPALSEAQSDLDTLREWYNVKC
jgi:hypothetical protein